MSGAPGKALWEADIALSQAATRFHSAKSLTAPYDDAPLDLTIFVSCYNEAGLIENTLETIRQVMTELPLSYEILVIDDVSKDHSAAVVEAYIAAHPNVNIVLRKNKHNRGLAQNYFDGAFLGKGKYYRLLCGDNSEPKETLKAIFSQVGSADILVPYYTSSEGKSLTRQIISKAYTLIVNTITSYRFHYYNGLAVHLRHNVMRWHPNTHGFGFQADLLCLLLDQGFTYKEIPVIMVEQRRGKSNAITFKNLLSVVHTLLEILLRRISHRVYKKK
ncbi:MAG: glycosyltransferase [Alphaproteobacteria bacterium]|nr:glycosyltransferase [Alphaproteobacteria bacterium]